jgi:GntR family carbon starvation induced transcriptional regulator
MMDGRRRHESGDAISPGLSVVDAVHHTLARDIVEGRLRPGQPLVVSVLTERLNVSAVPVREALRRLEGERLVEFMNNRGARVSGISLEEMRDIYYARRVTEPAAVSASVAAGAIDVEHLKSVFAQMKDSYLSARQPDAYQWHREFHHSLISTGTTPRLEEIVLSLLDESQRYLRLGPGMSTEAPELVELHGAILDAVVAGDSERVARELERHMDYSIAHLHANRIDTYEVMPADAAVFRDEDLPAMRSTKAPTTTVDG